MSSGTAGAEGAVFEPPFSIPESWAWCRLGDVCEIVLGGTPDTKKTQYWDGDIPWLTPGEMSELKDKYVSSTRRTLSQLGLEKGSRLFPSRSVILSTRAPIGYLFINSVPMSTNQGCKTLVPCRGLLPEYLYYNLLGRVDELKNLGTGTTFKELSSSALSSLCISIPPLAEQIRIVSFFEEISSLCEFIDNGEALFDLLARTAKKRILDLAIRGALVPQDPTDKPASVLLDRIRSTADKPPCPKKGKKREATIGDVLDPPFLIPESWAWTTLGDVAELVLGGTPDTHDSKCWGGDIPWLTPGEMSDIKGKYVSDTRRKLTRTGLEKASRMFPSRSVILSTRAPIGYLFINTVPMCTNQGCKTIVPKCGVLAEYLYYNLLGRVPELQSLGTGTTFKELSSGKLASLPLSLPPLAEQRRIVAKVDEMFATIDGMLG